MEIQPEKSSENRQNAAAKDPGSKAHRATQREAHRGEPASDNYLGLESRGPVSKDQAGKQTQAPGPSAATRKNSGDTDDDQEESDLERSVTAKEREDDIGSHEPGQSRGSRSQEHDIHTRNRNRTSLTEDEEDIPRRRQRK